MGRLIDCGNVYNAIQITSDNFGVAGQVVEDSMRNMLGEIPTADAVEREKIDKAIEEVDRYLFEQEFGSDYRKDVKEILNKIIEKEKL